ncbi:MAG: DUF1573 domain-containing protein [bacterium]|nr:DUF1573 domain-containing protein [bacterium]
MKNQTIIVFTLIVFGVWGLMVWGGSRVSTSGVIARESTTSHPARIGGTLTAEEIFYDFGTISMKNGKVNKTFKITNYTSEDIEVPSLTTSCMCTVAYVIEPDRSKKGPFGMPGHGRSVPEINEIIKAGETRSIEVVYDPNAHGPAGVGVINRFVYLEDSNGVKLQLEIKANVTP